MISVSGIRGIVGEGLTPEVITAYAAAFGTFCEGGKVIVGRDNRTTGEMVRHAALAGLLAVGCDVVDLGVVPTPTIQIAVEKAKATGGISFTASHNPDEWNALKFFSSDGLFLDEVQARELQALKDDWQVNYVPFDKIGHVSYYEGAADDHITAVLGSSLFDLQAIRKRNFRVAVDAVCGAGCNLIPQLLAELGCEVAKLNCEIKGRFPRNPEPLPEHLDDLCRLVKEKSCDLGFALDPDADRLAIIDENGNPISEENTLVIAAKLVLKHQPGPLVTNISTTRALDDIALEAEVPIHRTKVGEIHVVRKMQDVKAAIGGEGNGGVIFPGIHLGRDSAVGAAMTLQSLIEARAPLSVFLKSMPRYVMVKRKVHIEDLHPDELLAQLSAHFGDDQQDRCDGLKIVRDTGWIHMRASNTEPVIRIYAEGEDQSGAEDLAQEGAGALQQLIPKAESEA
jgi:phosphomannomutase